MDAWAAVGLRLAVIYLTNSSAGKSCKTFAGPGHSCSSNGLVFLVGYGGYTGWDDCSS